MDDFKEDDNVNEDSSILLQGMYHWFITIVVVALQVIKGVSRERNPSISVQKLILGDYLLSFAHQPKFIQRHLRMSLESFYKLLSLLRPDLEVDHGRANRRGGPILPEICLFCTLRWLAGGSYLYIYAITKVSAPSFYRVVYRTLKAINNCSKLEIKFPTTLQECQLAAGGFRSVSTKEAITNCIGLIDSYLLRIYTPTKAEAVNVRCFFSGHYQCYGINIQAICDHNCRFIFFALAAPGSTNNRDAVLETGIPNAIDKVPENFCIIGDAAYEPSERLVPLYYGISRLEPEHDNFNFYASQCRIRIEMAFGLMQMKWGILWRPMRVQLKNLKHITFAIARLHNFVIDERLLCQQTMEEVGTGSEKYYNESDPDEDYVAELIVGSNYTTTSSRKKYLRGFSFIRDEMVNRVTELKLTCPVNNIIKKRSILN
jgi:DDE superfamily endonuclease